ncbi:hypothetical protein EV2_048146 [Malus domestica]
MKPSFGAPPHSTDVQNNPRPETLLCDRPISPACTLPRSSPPPPIPSSTWTRIGGKFASDGDDDVDPNEEEFSSIWRIGDRVNVLIISSVPRTA